MFRKALFLSGVVFIAVLFVTGGLAFADNLADVQKRIKEKGLRWVAEEVRNPEGRGLGLIEDGVTVEVAPSVTEG